MRDGEAVVLAYLVTDRPGFSDGDAELFPRILLWRRSLVGLGTKSMSSPWIPSRPVRFQVRLGVWMAWCERTRDE